MASMRLTILDGGRVITQGVRFLAPDGREETRDMSDPNHCYLIHHPDGLLIWDTGLPDRIHALPGQVLESGKFRFVVEHPLAAQMQDIGIDSAQVDLLAFSHLQIDHAGNAGLFSRATVLVQAAEYALAFGRKARSWGYVRADYAMLAHQNVHKLEGDLDVFGDGKVKILSTPGHTPGHQVLYLDLPRSGPVLLSGDLYYAENDPAQGWIPAWNYDAEETRRSIQRIEAFAAETGARWIINHQPGSVQSGGME